MALRVFDEISHFAGRLRIDDATDARPGAAFEEAAPVRNNANSPAIQASGQTQKFRRIVGLEFELLLCIEETGKQTFHVIRQAVIAWKDSV